EKFYLASKPRGIVQSKYVGAFDKQLQPGQGSDVIAAKLKVDGSLGKVGDVVSRDELEALLKEVRRVVGEMGDGILAGEVGISPYLLRNTGACAYCTYKSVCRFDRMLNRYRRIEGGKREDVLHEIRVKGGKR